MRFSSQHHGKAKRDHSHPGRGAPTDKLLSNCRNCGQTHRYGECRAKNTVCRACGKLGHYCITTGRQRMPRSHSKQRVSGNSRSKSPAAPRSVHEVTDQSQNQSADGVYIDNVQIYSTSASTKSWTKTLHINYSDRVQARLRCRGKLHAVQYVLITTLSQQHPANIRAALRIHSRSSSKATWYCNAEDKLQRPVLKY